MAGRRPRRAAGAPADRPGPLTGPGSLLQQLTKQILESALEGEIDDHLGYPKHAMEGRDGGNSRNGSRTKTVATEVGPVEVAIPRDRDGTFSPAIIGEASAPPFRGRRSGDLAIGQRPDPRGDRRPPGRHAWRVPIPPQCGGVPEPAALRDVIHAVRKAGREISMVVLTVPDNPTGTTAPPELIRELCEIAAREDILIVCDEIYRDLLHDPALEFLSPVEVEPHRTVVLTGLSKSLALGGWRIGAARFPTSQFFWPPAS